MKYDVPDRPHPPVANLLPRFDAEGRLFCPRCGDDYAHSGDVRIYDRDGGERGVPQCLVVDGTTVSYVRNPQKCPSSRRHAIEILFRGECGHHFSITFAQHKGQTFVEARPLVREP